MSNREININSNQIDDEDDWEKAELRLADLELARVKAIAASTPVILPPYKPKPIDDNNNQSNKLYNGIPYPIPLSPVDEPIDQALLDAVVNPRERMILLHLEKQIDVFVKSNEIQKLFPPGFNSFRRLLLYRVAQRFHLTHAPSNEINESGDRGIIISKTPDSCLPRSYLIDLPYDNPNNSESSLDLTNKLTITSNDSLASESTSSKSTDISNLQPKKFLMMKRTTNNNMDSNGNSKKELLLKSNASTNSLDKEKAYAEAKARIFGETSSTDLENEQSADMSRTNSSESISSTTVATNSSKKLSKSQGVIVDGNRETSTLVDKAKDKIKQVDKKVGKQSDNLVDRLSDRPVDRQVDKQIDKPKDKQDIRVLDRKQIDNTKNWKSKKALERDKVADDNDPDFRRALPQSIPLPAPPTNYQSNSYNTYNNPPAVYNYNNVNSNSYYNMPYNEMPIDMNSYNYHNNYVSNAPSNYNPNYYVPYQQQQQQQQQQVMYNQVPGNGIVYQNQGPNNQRNNGNNPMFNKAEFPPLR